MVHGNSGYIAGLAKRSKVERLVWAWKGATKNCKERRLTTADAIREGRTLAALTARKLETNGMDGKNARVALVFVDAENSRKMKGLVFFQFPDRLENKKDIEALEKYHLDTPAGFIVAIADPQNGNLLAQERPLILHGGVPDLLRALAERTMQW